MDSYSSGDKFNIKTRKPYTITKQRERWTEEEHNSFLEALKLYGRAWQRIEEHIGTKTAVQIRSHAQKFFTKLEKEAVAKGVPIKQALDMEIPPPRPKRKPNYPYPRKNSPTENHPMQQPEKDGQQATLVSSLQILGLEKKPLPEETSHEEKLENAKTSEEVENGNVPSSENENSVPVRSVEGVFREFIPSFEEVVINHEETNESYITIKTRKHQKSDEDGIIKHTNITSSNTSFNETHENIIIQGRYSDKPGAHSYPRHVPVQVVDGNQGIGGVPPLEMSFQESTFDKSGVADNIATASLTNTCNYQTNPPTFNPLFATPFCDHNQENYTSFLHVSSTISSLIVSSLLQNPAAHAAASFAATFWNPPPAANTEAAASSGNSFSRDTPPPPSMAAIAAATVAAATAWWAAHGLLPVCTHPFYQSTNPFSLGTPSPIDGNNQAKLAKAPPPSEGVLQQEEKMDAEKTASSDDSDRKLNDAELSPVDDTTTEMTPVVELLHDSTMTNNAANNSVRKQVDRSSCGSNTTSSSEIETDALENQNQNQNQQQHGKENEDNTTKGLDVNLACNDSISRRNSSRSIISPSESWKEVSEEGRLAFQALFSREVLPQSFSNTQHNNNTNGLVINNSKLDLNRTSQEACGESYNGGFAGEKIAEEGLLRMGLGSVKLNVHHTGFKPYKRCSYEAAKETKGCTTGSSSIENEEKGPKRMRLEAAAAADAST